jgi:hypothetical protein
MAKPMLVLGRELSRFLHERRQKAKQSCGPGRIFCIACRAPKVPAGKMAHCTATGPLAGSLCGAENLLEHRVTCWRMLGFASTPTRTGRPRRGLGC